jgi:hypothetical protein
MRFILFEKQSGYGCDYTIGCGLRFRRLQAQTMEDAKAEVLTERLQNADDREDDTGASFTEERDEIRLWAVAEEVDLMPWLEARAGERRRAAATARQKTAEDAERAAYERLRKKFG